MITLLPKLMPQNNFNKLISIGHPFISKLCGSSGKDALLCFIVIPRKILEQWS